MACENQLTCVWQLQGKIIKVKLLKYHHFVHYCRMHRNRYFKVISQLLKTINKAEKLATPKRSASPVVSQTNRLTYRPSDLPTDPMQWKSDWLTALVGVCGGYFARPDISAFIVRQKMGHNDGLKVGQGPTLLLRSLRQVPNLFFCDLPLSFLKPCQSDSRTSADQWTPHGWIFLRLGFSFVTVTYLPLSANLSWSVALVLFLRCIVAQFLASLSNPPALSPLEVSLPRCAPILALVVLWMCVSGSLWVGLVGVVLPFDSRELDLWCL